jgi:hypothetical protein
MAYKVGYRTVKPTLKEMRGVTKFLTKALMIVTTKVIHGMLINILNYDYYQSLINYEGHNEGHNINKKGKRKKERGERTSPSPA